MPLSLHLPGGQFHHHFMSNSCDSRFMVLPAYRVKVRRNTRRVKLSFVGETEQNHFAPNDMCQHISASWLVKLTPVGGDTFCFPPNNTLEISGQKSGLSFLCSQKFHIFFCRIHKCLNWRACALDIHKNEREKNVCRSINNNTKMISSQNLNTFKVNWNNHHTSQWASTIVKIKRWTLYFLGHFIIFFIRFFYTFNFVRREKNTRGRNRQGKKLVLFIISIDSITPLNDSQVVLHIIESSFAQWRSGENDNHKKTGNSTTT